MRSTILTPSHRLRPFVKRFMAVESERDFTSTLLPDTSLVMGFRFEGVGTQETNGHIAKLPQFTLAGLRDSIRSLQHEKGGIFLTVFTETGAAAFFRDPLDSLFNDMVPIDCLLDRTALHPLEGRLFEATDHSTRMETMEDFLLQSLRAPEPDGEVSQALAAIHRANGNLRIEGLAREVGLSQSALERRFRRLVGTSPKQLASIVRLRYVVRRQAEGANLAEIAHEAGYFDQPHFVKDFRSFTGQAPETFFRTTEFW